MLVSAIRVSATSEVHRRAHFCGPSRPCQEESACAWFLVKELSLSQTLPLGMCWRRAGVDGQDPARASLTENSGCCVLVCGGSRLYCLVSAACRVYLCVRTLPTTLYVL